MGCKKNKKDQCICNLTKRFEELEALVLNMSSNPSVLTDNNDRTYNHFDGVNLNTVIDTNLDYKVYTALTSFKLSILTFGLLEIGKEYVIDRLEVGDDFSNVGYVNEGVSFIATGTSPLNWTNFSEAIDIIDSQPEITILENTTNETFDWTYDYTTGVVCKVSNNALVEDKTVIYTGNYMNLSLVPTHFYRVDTETIEDKSISLFQLQGFSIEVRIYC